MTKKIATAYVRFVQLKNGKRRPIFVLKENNNKIIFFDITTKYKNKSDFIKQWYFEIRDYSGTGLNKHSWIDTFRVYSLNKTDENEIKYIGDLSDNDTHRLVKFLEANSRKK